MFPGQLLGIQMLERLIVNAGDRVTVSEYFVAVVVSG
jgi:hypothetical protein